MRAAALVALLLIMALAGCVGPAGEPGPADPQEPTGLTFATPTPVPENRYAIVKEELEALTGLFLGPKAEDAAYYENILECGGAKALVDGLVQGVIPGEFLYRHEAERYGSWSYGKAGQDAFQRPVRVNLGYTFGSVITWAISIAELNSRGSVWQWTSVASGVLRDGCEAHTESVEPIW